MVDRRDDVDLGCRTALRTHSNMVKQKERMRGWLWAATGWLSSGAAAVQIRKSAGVALAAALAHQVE